MESLLVKLKYCANANCRWMALSTPTSLNSTLSPCRSSLCVFAVVFLSDCHFRRQIEPGGRLVVMVHLPYLAPWHVSATLPSAVPADGVPPLLPI